jgi:hypothetical protein
LEKKIAAGEGHGTKIGEWRMASGEWRVASSEWRVENGEWRMEKAREFRYIR